MIQDEFGFSSPLLILLPETNKVALDLSAGQDGSQTYFLAFENNTIHIEKSLDEDVNYFFTVNDNQVAVCWNFDENLLLTYRYPDMVFLKEFNFDELAYEWYLSDFIKINEHLLLTTNGYDERMYLFDINTMSIIDELLVENYELRQDDEGILVSDVIPIAYQNQRFILQACKNGKTQFLLSDEVIFS